MTKLEMSEALQRIIRKDDVSELTIPTWDLISEAIKAGRTEEALELLEYVHYETRDNNDTYVSMAEMLINHIISLGDEEEAMKIWYQRAVPKIKSWLSTTTGVEETLRRCVELQRGHHGDLTIVEEPDRYVVRYDPCGSMGRLRRIRSVATTKKAYPWSWGKAGVPYYCCHCCIQWEIVAIELRGYPIRISTPGDKPEDPCVHLFYKKPELIPEEYFTRVGMKKDISKFK